MEWTTSQQSQLSERGLTSIKGFYSTKRLAPVRDIILRELERLQFRKSGRWTAGPLENRPVFQRSLKLSQLVSAEPGFSRLFDGDLTHLIDLASGRKCRPQNSVPQLLLSLPDKEPWKVPTMNWHLDVKVTADFSSPGLQAFVLLDDVSSQGGATLALAGSHRLHRLAPSGGAHQVLRQHPYWSALYTPDRAATLQIEQVTPVNEIPVSIIEMSGRAGDVYIMDLRILHSPSLNSSKNLRMMGTNRFI